MKCLECAGLPNLLDVFDCLSEAVVVIDASGVIVLVNRVWKDFSVANGIERGVPAPRTGLGSNYLHVCRDAAGREGEGGRAALDGIQAVLDGRMGSFSLEYPCHSPDRERWFSMRVLPLGCGEEGAVITHVNVTDYRLAEQSARDAQAQLASMTSAVPGVVCRFQRSSAGQWQVLYVSSGIEDLYEITSEAALADPLAMTGYIVAEDQAAHRAAVERSADNLECWTHEYRIRTPGNKVKWVRGQAMPHLQGDGSVQWDGILVDITARKQAEEALRESEERWSFALEGANEGVWDWNLQTGKAHYSRRWKEMFGYSDSEIGDLAAEWSSRVHPDDMAGVMQAVNAHLAGETPTAAVEFRMRCKGGDWRWTLGRGMLVSRDATGNPQRLVGTNSDITERKQMEAQLHQLAFYDVLTQLPNRRLLVDRLSQTMAVCRRTGRRSALMFLDLDNFKSLNDRAGHAVGDLLLIEVANRLRRCTREMDTVARLGGDEFVVLIGELDLQAGEPVIQAIGIARKIRSALSEPYRLNAGRADAAEILVEHRCTASIGIALLDSDEATLDDALSCADKAMYQAKREGPNSIRLLDTASRFAQGGLGGAGR